MSRLVLSGACNRGLKKGSPRKLERRVVVVTTVRGGCAKNEQPQLPIYSINVKSHGS